MTRHSIGNVCSPEFSLFVGDVSEHLDDYSLFTIFVSKYLSCKSASSKEFQTNLCILFLSAELCYFCCPFVFDYYFSSFLHFVILCADLTFAAFIFSAVERKSCQLRWCWWMMGNDFTSYKVSADICHELLYSRYSSLVRMLCNGVTVADGLQLYSTRTAGVAVTVLSVSQARPSNRRHWLRCRAIRVQTKSRSAFR